MLPRPSAFSSNRTNGRMMHKREKRQGNAKVSRQGAPPDVKTIKTAIKKFLDTKVEGEKIGNAKHGVYVFYDYDGEPIYVGQTYETLRSRIGRHLTNQRTDAVAMNVLDPFEVAEIEVWPLRKLGRKQARTILNRTEYTVSEKVTKE